jgi:hypothetical protein
MPIHGQRQEKETGKDSQAQAQEATAPEPSQEKR